MLTVALDRCLQVFDVIVPLRCAICGWHGAQICNPCRESLGSRALLWRAQSQNMPAVVALGPYTGTLRAAVLAAKFRNRRGAAECLGAIFGRKLPGGTDAIVPVPLHQRRLRSRGFNQAEAIAEGIASTMGVPLAVDAVVRARYTEAQSVLALRERRLNVINAFAAGPQAHDLRGRRVMIVDDVVTTGATIAACASALRTAGVTQIVAAALAIRL